MICVKNLKGRAFQRGFERYTRYWSRVLLLNNAGHTCEGLGPRLQPTNMADDTDDCGKVTQKRRGHYREYMRYSNPYKFPAARRRKGNLYKSKQSSTGTCNNLKQCNVEELIPKQTSTQAQPLCSHGDVAELFFAETNSTMLGEAIGGLVFLGQL